MRDGALEGLDFQSSVPLPWLRTHASAAVECRGPSPSSPCLPCARRAVQGGVCDEPHQGQPAEDPDGAGGAAPPEAQVRSHQGEEEEEEEEAGKPRDRQDLCAKHRNACVPRLTLELPSTCLISPAHPAHPLPQRWDHPFDSWVAVCFVLALCFLPRWTVPALLTWLVASTLMSRPGDAGARRRPRGPVCRRTYLAGSLLWLSLACAATPLCPTPCVRCDAVQACRARWSRIQRA